MSDARAAILGRIRSQLGQAAKPSARDYEAIPRAYRQVGARSPESCIALLIERLIDYDADVIETDEASISNSITQALARGHDTALLIPDGLPQAWLPDGIELLRDAPGPHALTRDTLTRASAVLTNCAGAIAETGTILLDHTAGQGRRVLTLLPDHHLCVVRRSQVVETVSEGFRLVAGAAAVTTISGPSATADIEMTRIRGVHGPRRLTVFLLP